MILLISSASQGFRIFPTPNKAFSWALDFSPPLSVESIASVLIGSGREGGINKLVQKLLLITAG